MARAKVQSIEEPPGQWRDGKRPDGASVIPWRRDRNVTWDVTVANTFAAYLLLTLQSGQVLLQSERAAAKKKNEKYDELCRNYIFIPLACEVTGVWNIEVDEFLADLGSRISCTTGEARDMWNQFFVSEAVYLVTEGECCMHL